MIIFTQHSLLKLKQRNIKRIFVIETLKKPDRQKPSYGLRYIAYKKFEKLYLKVIFKKENKNIIVVTQYWTKDIK